MEDFGSGVTRYLLPGGVLVRIGTAHDLRSIDDHDGRQHHDESLEKARRREHSEEVMISTLSGAERTGVEASKFCGVNIAGLYTSPTRCFGLPVRCIDLFQERMKPTIEPLVTRVSQKRI